MGQQSHTPLPSSNEVETSSQTTPPLPLDSKGDIILVVSDHANNASRSFLVSSKVLSLASPVFEKMFGPDFKEGMQLQQETQPCIHLEEDDPEAMETILRLLHYQTADSMFSMDPKSLAILAIHCDKYDLRRALTPWITQWFTSDIEITHMEEYGFLILATYLCRAPTFHQGTSHAMKHLPPDFMSSWEKHDILALIPESFTTEVSDYIAETLDELHAILQAAEERIQDARAFHATPAVSCIVCGRNYPRRIRRCDRCGNTELVQLYCTADTRVAEYFFRLRNNELWPSIKPFTTCSLDSISSRFKKARDEHAEHHICNGGADCPLKVEFNKICDQVKTVLSSENSIDFEKLMAQR